MADHQDNRPLPPAGISGYVEHARFRAAQAPGGIGAALTRSFYGPDGHRWECVVSDGRVHHYVTLVAPGLGPRPNLSSYDLETAVERFAARLPAEGRLPAVSRANPLHLAPGGEIES